MKIGELAEAVGVTTKTIRFYESFGLLPEPPRTASGYRSYADADAERMRFIKTAQRLGLSLDEIREIIAFRDRGERPCGYVAAVLDRQVRDLDRRLEDMRQLRDELRQLQSRAAQETKCRRRLLRRDRAHARDARPDLTTGPLWLDLPFEGKVYGPEMGAPGLRCCGGGGR